MTITANSTGRKGAVASIGSLGVHPTAIPEADATVIAFPDTDEAINRAIAQYQDRTGWIYGAIDLSKIICRIRGWSRDLWTRFVPDNWQGRPIKQPPILFRFEWEGPHILGHFQPGRNDIGLLWEISLNPRCFPYRTEIEIAETILHEIFHCFEDLAGIAPRSRGGYHSVFLRKSLDDLGIPCSRHGATLGIRDESPFIDWARERGLKGSPAVSVETTDLPAASTPKRAVWVCGCPPDIAVAVSVASASSLHARCEKCGETFKRRRARGPR